MCTSAVPSAGHAHYGLAAYKYTFDVNVCANNCQSQPNNIEGQIGFDMHGPLAVADTLLGLDLRVLLAQRGWTG